MTDLGCPGHQRVALTFADGTSGVVDLTRHVYACAFGAMPLLRSLSGLLPATLQV